MIAPIPVRQIMLSTNHSCQTSRLDIVRLSCSVGVRRWWFAVAGC